MTEASLRLQGEEDFISRHEIAETVSILGNYYTKLYEQNPADELLAVALMEGGMYFASDLTRAIQHPRIIVGTLRPKRHEGLTSGEEIVIHNLTDYHWYGKHVLLIDNAISKGKTSAKVTRRIADHGPASLSIALMFEKPENRLPGTELAADNVQIGMQLANTTALGYGLGWNGYYRNLPHVTKAVKQPDGFIVPKVPFEP